MLTLPIKISLEAARVNARLTQSAVAELLTTQFGFKVSRQRVAGFEEKPQNVPPAFAKALSDVYSIPLDNLSFFER